MNETKINNNGNCVNISKVTVGVRVRPLNAHNIQLNNKLKNKYKNIKPILSISKDGSHIHVHNPKKVSITQKTRHEIKKFEFDKIFDSQVNQKQLFNELMKANISKILNGYNACCFTYGTTLSGKTYSVYGDLSDINHYGLLPQSIDELFANLTPINNNKYNNDNNIQWFDIKNIKEQKQCCVALSFVDVYMNKVNDLTQYYNKENYKRKALKIRETSNGLVYIEGMNYIPIKSKNDIINIIKTIKKNCKESSKSHTICTLSLLVKKDDNNHENSIILNDDENIIPLLNNDISFTDESSTINGAFNINDYNVYSKLHFIDMASITKNLSINETIFINKSLIALSKVMISLSNRKKYKYIPFRESKLTRLLKNSLNGNCYLTLLSTINPNPINYDDILQTLVFTNRCKNIHTSVYSNYFYNESKLQKLQKIIQNLLNELSDAKFDMISTQNGNNFNNGSLQLHLKQNLNALLNAAQTPFHTHTQSKASLQFNHSNSQNILRSIHTLSNTALKINDKSLSKSISNQLFHNGSSIDITDTNIIGKQYDVNVNEEHIERIAELEREINELHVKHHETEVSTNETLNKIRKENVSLKQENDMLHVKITNLEKDFQNKLDLSIKDGIKSNKELIQNLLMRLLNEPSHLIKKSIKILLQNDYHSLKDINKSIKLNQDLINKTMNENNHNPEPNFKQKYKELAMKLDVDKQNEINAIKRELNEKILYKKKEIEKLSMKLKNMEKDEDSKYNTIYQEISNLYECINKLITIIESIENGEYNVNIKSGIKKIDVPKTIQFSRNKSIEYISQRFNNIQQLIRLSNAFIIKQNDYNKHNKIKDSIVVEMSNDNIDTKTKNDNNSIDRMKIYEDKVMNVTKSLNSLKIAFESQKRLLSNKIYMYSASLSHRSRISHPSMLSHRSILSNDKKINIINRNRPQSARTSTNIPHNYNINNKRKRPSSAYGCLTTNKINFSFI